MGKYIRSTLLSAKGQLRYGLLNASLYDVKKSIARGADVNQMDNYDPERIAEHTFGTIIYRLKKRNCTPLVYAIKHSKNPVQFTQILLDAKADVNDNRSEYLLNRSPLAVALNNDELSLDEQIEVIKLLLDANVNIQSDYERKCTVRFLSMLMKQGTAEAITLCKGFLKAGLDVNHPLVDDLLHDAIFAKNMTFIKYLLTQKPIDQFGYGTHRYHFKNMTSKNTPLINAIYEGDIHVIRFLLKQHVNTNSRDDNALLPLEVAISVNDLAIVNLLIEYDVDLAQFTSKDEPILIHAIRRNNNDEIVKALLANGADINQVSHNDKTVLHYAVMNYRDHIIPWLLDTASVKLINFVDNLGNTALYIAAQTDQLNVVKLLLDAGAIDFANKRGLTAEMMAGNNEIKTLLTEANEKRQIHLYSKAFQLVDHAMFNRATVGEHHVKDDAQLKKRSSTSHIVDNRKHIEQRKAAHRSYPTDMLAEWTLLVTRQKASLATDHYDDQNDLSIRQTSQPIVLDLPINKDKSPRLPLC